ncbi:MAG: methanogenesis marker 16 metalloprotein [Euryarchaeota archaeon]|nr:methanogenesis marker 16 metalloprotein [Euryarchaeota archaeon]
MPQSNVPIRSIEEINAKITAGEVTVCTAYEFGNMVRAHEDVNEVDVVTCGTKGIMSGTYAILSFQATAPNVFETAQMAWLNDVPAFVGPCPNERLGLLDLIVYGTAVSRSDSKYGGGHLFREIVRGNNIDFEVLTTMGRLIKGQTNLQAMQFARLSATRNVFRNYNAFVNPNDSCIESIFSVTCLEGPYKEASFSGCGELNPLEKDPHLETIGVGTKVLFNGVVGFVTGTGTRSSAQKPNLSGYAPLDGMNPKYVGGFNTSAGPDVFCSWAIPIPILNTSILEHACRTDDQIPLPIVDVNGRKSLGYARYSDVWQRTYGRISYSKEDCASCEECQVVKNCPTTAFSLNEGIDRNECVRCGACLSSCPYGALKGNLGAIELNGQQIPVTLRQSDRYSAEKLTRELKKKIELGEFLLSAPVQKIEL